MSKHRLAGIIVACTIAIIAAIVLVLCRPWEQLYTLSVTIDPPQAGSASLSPTGGVYDAGQRVILTAIPAGGYTFDRWSGAVSGNSAGVTITMDSDKTLTANFRASPETYSLTVNISPSGAGTTSPPAGDFEQGAQIVLLATPTPGYEFSHWSGDISGIDPTVTLIMGKDTNVIANFEHEYVWMTPVDATASGYTKWGDTWYTGPPSLAIDGKTVTAWTLNDMGDITFDLGSEKVVAGIDAYWGGHVTNGNTVNVYVDGEKVLANEQFGATSNVRYFTPILGRFVKYQTVALPHNEYLQIATWSEIAEFKVKVLTE
jgi:uncharacterized repeat protein (TIGR02543 family)